MIFWKHTDDDQDTVWLRRLPAVGYAFTTTEQVVYVDDDALKALRDKLNEMYPASD